MGQDRHKELSPSHLEKVTAIADLRQNAASEVADIGSFAPGDARDRLKDTVRKRHPAVEAAMEVVKDSLLFTKQRSKRVVAFDGKVMAVGMDEKMMK